MAVETVPVLKLANVTTFNEAFSAPPNILLRELSVMNDRRTRVDAKYRRESESVLPPWTATLVDSLLARVLDLRINAYMRSLFSDSLASTLEPVL